MQIKKGCIAVYKNQDVQVIRGAFPRFGRQRVVVERIDDKRRFTVAVDNLQTKEVASKYSESSCCEVGCADVDTHNLIAHGGNSTEFAR